MDWRCWELEGKIDTWGKQQRGFQINERGNGFHRRKLEMVETVLRGLAQVPAETDPKGKEYGGGI